MKKHLLFFLMLLSLLPMTAQAHGVNCATVTSRHYYASGVNNDYLVHDIDICMSQTRKSVRYELPPLTAPLTLTSTDQFNLTVTIAELESGEEVMTMFSHEITFSLPVTDGSVRYMMTVSVSTRSNGIIIGRYQGQEVGKILLLDTHSSQSDTLTVAMGGLSGKWWFSIADMPESSTASFALTDSPDADGHFDITGSWQEIPESTGSENPADYLVIGQDDWSATGDYAIRVTFPR